MTATQAALLSEIKTAQELRSHTRRRVGWNRANRVGRTGGSVWSRGSTLTALVRSGLVECYAGHDDSAISADRVAYLRWCRVVAV